MVLDYLHLCISVPPKYSNSDFMGYLKGKSPLMVYDRYLGLQNKYLRSPLEVAVMTFFIPFNRWSR